jgi:hypothetical protein
MEVFNTLTDPTKEAVRHVDQEASLCQQKKPGVGKRPYMAIYLPFRLDSLPPGY